MLGVKESSHLLRLLSHISVFRSQLGRSMLVEEAKAPVPLFQEQSLLSAIDLLSPSSANCEPPDMEAEADGTLQVEAGGPVGPVQWSAASSRHTVSQAEASRGRRFAHGIAAPGSGRPRAKSAPKSNSHNSSDGGLAGTARRAAAAMADTSARRGKLASQSSTSDSRGRVQRPLSADSRSGGGHRRLSRPSTATQKVERTPRQQSRQTARSSSPTRSHNNSWALSVASVLESSPEGIPVSQPAALSIPCTRLVYPTCAVASDEAGSGHHDGCGSDSDSKSASGLSTVRGPKRVGSSPQLSRAPSTSATSRRSMNISGTSSAGRSSISGIGSRHSAQAANDSVNSEFGRDHRRGASFGKARRESNAAEVVKQRTAPGPADYQSSTRSSSLADKNFQRFGRDRRRTMEGMECCQSSPGSGKYAPPERVHVQGGSMSCASRWRRGPPGGKPCGEKSPGPMSYTPRHHFRSGFK